MNLKSTANVTWHFLILFHCHSFEVKSAQEEMKTLSLELEEHLKDHMVPWLLE